MPQVTNRKLLREKHNCPIGQGTVYSALLKISAATRERVVKANECEITRFNKIVKSIDKSCKDTQNMQCRIIDRMSKHLKEFQAFKKVVQNDYCISKFQTLKTFDAEVVQRRRWNVETRFYHAGFDMKSMKPEIKRKLKQMDPERQRRMYKRRILEESRRETSMLSKTNIATSAMLENLRARQHTHRYKPECVHDLTNEMTSFHDNSGK